VHSHLLRVAGLWLLVAGLLAGCAGSGAQAGGSAPPVNPAVTISSGALEFATRSLAAPAGAAFDLLYVNEGPLPHNVAIYADESAGEPIFAGEVIETGRVIYELPALAAGSYFFRCDLHPDMNGTLTVD
jgi:plastocyanin